MRRTGRSSTTPSPSSKASPRSRKAKSRGGEWWCASADGAEPLIAVLEAAQAEGFLGPGDVRTQLDHARAFSALLDPPHRFLDLGTGGGLPGLVLATEWPDARAVLLDRRQRSIAFAERAIATLGLADRLTALEASAEAAARNPNLRAAFDLVVARSFGPPAVTAEGARGFLRAGGHLAVSEPPGGTPTRWPAPQLADLAYSSAEIRSRHGATAAVLTAEGDPPDKWPRPRGTPRKRPLWT